MIKHLLALALATAVIHPVAAKETEMLWLIQEYCYDNNASGMARWVRTDDCHKDSSGMMKITATRFILPMVVAMQSHFLTCGEHQQREKNAIL